MSATTQVTFNEVVDWKKELPKHTHLHFRTIKVKDRVISIEFNELEDVDFVCKGYDEKGIIVEKDGEQIYVQIDNPVIIQQIVDIYAALNREELSKLLPANDKQEGQD